MNTSVRPIFFGATLIALQKPNGDIRPIAEVSSRLSKELSPIQLGVGTRLGCEAAVHATREYISRISGSPKVILKLDMKNAFNSVRRDVVLKAVERRIPELYHLAWDAYHEPSHLFYGDHLVASSTGVQQGDPLGPTFFSLAIDDIARSVQLELELNVWYLDDACIGGDPVSVLKALRIVLAGLSDVGLEVNASKCELMILNHSFEEQANIVEQFRQVLPI